MKKLCLFAVALALSTTALWCLGCKGSNSNDFATSAGAPGASAPPEGSNVPGGTAKKGSNVMVPHAATPGMKTGIPK